MADAVITTAPARAPAAPGTWRQRVWQPVWEYRAQLASLSVGLGLMEILGRWLHFPFLPPVSAVIIAAWQMILSGEILGNLAVSLVGLASGFGLAASLGMLIGALMGRYRKVEHFLDLHVNAMLAAPSLIFVPILFAFFGVSRLSQVSVVFLYSFFSIIANTMAGIRTVDTHLVEMGRSFGATERQLFWKVMLPGALPLIMAGLRIGMGRAVKGMINGEMFIALIGLGALLKHYGSRFEADRVLGILLVIIVVAVITAGIVQALDRRLTKWAD